LLEVNFAGRDTPVKSTGAQQGFQKEEHSRGSRKRSTAGAPRHSTVGAVRKERGAQQGLQYAAQQWLRKVLNWRRMKYKNRILRG
jgi:hypothetical protein